MASWKWIAGVGTAAVGLVAAPVAESLVKEGKFPDGLGAMASTLWSWVEALFAAQISLPWWVVLLLLLSIGISVRGLIMARRRVLQEGEPAPIIDQLRQELQVLSREHAALKSTKEQLKAQLVTLAESRESQQSRNAALEAEIVSQRDANANLKQQLAEKLQTPKEAEVELPDFASKVLWTIASYANLRIEPSLILVSSSVGGQVEAEGAIDILLEHQMVKMERLAGSNRYSLTPKGRAYYLRHRDQDQDAVGT